MQRITAGGQALREKETFGSWRGWERSHGLDGLEVDQHWHPFGMDCVELNAWQNSNGACPKQRP
jgi:hypothetical protein